MTFINRKAAIAGLIALFLPIGATHAQTGDLLKRAQTNTQIGNSPVPIENIISSQAPNTNNINNVVGVLEYCIRNNYLSSDGATSIEDSLKGKLSDTPPSSSQAYTDGVKGILHGSDGKPIELGGGVKAAATQQICDTVLSAAKSML